MAFSSKADGYGGWGQDSIKMSTDVSAVIPTGRLQCWDSTPGLVLGNRNHERHPQLLGLLLFILCRGFFRLLVSVCTKCLPGAMEVRREHGTSGAGVNS